MPELPSQTLRRAAAAIRGDMQRLLDEMDRRPDYWDASLGDEQAYGLGVDGGLGGPAGKYAAAWHPGVAVAVADWLDTVAAEMDSVAEDFGGWDGLRSDPQFDPAWKAAARTARAYLGEAVEA